MKQYQIRSILIGCMLLCLTGCTANSEKKRDVLRVGVVLYTQDDPFINALTDCLKEDLADYFRERLEAIYDSPDALAQSLAGYDYSEDGTAPYGYSYLADGKVWICMEVPHALGDYIEIELDTQ